MQEAIENIKEKKQNKKKIEKIFLFIIPFEILDIKPENIQQPNIKLFDLGRVEIIDMVLVMISVSMVV